MDNDEDEDMDNDEDEDMDNDEDEDDGELYDRFKLP